MGCQLRHGVTSQPVTVSLSEIIFLILLLTCVVTPFLPVNLQGRSLLSQSVTFLDESIDLTRILINHGARVWPDSELTKPTSVAEIIQDKEQSAFTWFLRAVIKQRTLASTDTTLNCLSHEMGKQPRRMKVSFGVALYVLPNFTSSFSGPRVEGDGVGRPPPKSPRTGLPPVEALHGALLVRDTLLLLSPCHTFT